MHGDLIVVVDEVALEESVLESSFVDGTYLPLKFLVKAHADNNL